MSRSTLLARTTIASSLISFLAGGVHAAIEIAGRHHILEFQAGEGASSGERILAIAHAAAIEGVGWGAFGFVAALVATLISLRTARDARTEAFLSNFVLIGAALFGWLSITWLADVVFPFLSTPWIMLLNLSGLVAAFLAFALYANIVRWVPAILGAQRRSRLAATLASTLAGGVVLWYAQITVLQAGEAARSMQAASLLVAIAVAGVALSALGAAVVDAGVQRLLIRLSAGPLLPRSGTAVLSLALVGCVVWTGPLFRLSSLAQAIDYASVDGTARTEVRGPHVVFVTIDTLRADHLSCYGYERATSPFLDSLAEGGVRFQDAVSPAAWTKPATGTIFTGLYPSRHGALYHGSRLQLPEGKQTVAEAFRDAGYVTAGFVSNPNVKAIFDFDRGFDVFFDSPVEDTLTLACIRTTWFGRALMDLLRHQFNWKYENDVRQMNQHVAGWLRENADERFFLYVHYIDPHIPYDPPAQWRDEFAQAHGFVTFNQRKELVGRDLYDAEIRYTDEGLRELVGTLKEIGAWDDTLFVVTSDHGEEFFEHEVLGHGFSLFQPVVGVPVILHGAGVARGAVVEEPVAVLDLPATVLELAGIGDGRFGDGASFASAARGEAWNADRILFLENEFGQDDSNQRAFVFTGVRQGRWKLVLTEANAYFPPGQSGHTRQALYDLEDDPGELRNLIEDPQHRELIEGLLAALREHSTFLLEQGFRDVKPAALSDDIRANLEALGY